MPRCARSTLLSAFCSSFRMIFSTSRRHNQPRSAVVASAIRERHIEDPGKRLGPTASCRNRLANQENIGFGEFNVVVLGRVIEPACSGCAQPPTERAWRAPGRSHSCPGHCRSRSETARRRGLDERVLILLPDDVHAQLDAFIADEHGRTGDQLTHLMLALAAEGAVQGVFLLACHSLVSPSIAAGSDARSPGTRPATARSAEPNSGLQLRPGPPRPGRVSPSYRTLAVLWSLDIDSHATQESFLQSEHAIVDKIKDRLTGARDLRDYSASIKAIVYQFGINDPDCDTNISHTRESSLNFMSHLVPVP